MFIIRIVIEVESAANIPEFVCIHFALIVVSHVWYDIDW